MKLIEVIAEADTAEHIAAIAEAHSAPDFRKGIPNDSGLLAMRLLSPDDQVQSILDDLQGVLLNAPDARVHVIPVEMVLPKPPEEERKKEATAIAAREALYADAARNATLDWNFVVLVMLSTVVAAIGLVEGNVAVVIGAMVIAPLLGPNIAFGLGTALGDGDLMRRALTSLAAGIAIAFGLSVLIGLIWPFEIDSAELLARTNVGLDSVALALASGAAAALSVTTGLSSVLVGVMVAVALLPPTATLGLYLGHGMPQLAAGAGLLLAVNVVSVNLACKLVFLLKGIAPRTWWEQKSAKRGMRNYILVWIVTLALLLLAIQVRNQLNLDDHVAAGQPIDR